MYNLVMLGGMVAGVLVFLVGALAIEITDHKSSIPFVITGAGVVLMSISGLLVVGLEALMEAVETLLGAAVVLVFMTAGILLIRKGLAMRGEKTQASAPKS